VAQLAAGRLHGGACLRRDAKGVDRMRTQMEMPLAACHGTGTACGGATCHMQISHIALGLAVLSCVLCGLC